MNDSVIVYEFKIEGMTCVACSSAIENGLRHEYKDKGLVCDNGVYQVSVVLLMHKMKISFRREEAEQHGVTAGKIAEEVEDLGFGASLINTYEVDNELNSSNLNIDEEAGKSPAVKMKESTFVVKGMTCASCSGAIEKHFSTLEGV